MWFCEISNQSHCLSQRIPSIEHLDRQIPHARGDGGSDESKSHERLDRLSKKLAALHFGELTALDQ
jgi:hypothetical protein